MKFEFNLNPPKDATHYKVHISSTNFCEIKFYSKRENSPFYGRNPNINWWEYDPEYDNWRGREYVDFLVEIKHEDRKPSE